MADYLTTDTELTSIADAIRAKGGTSAPLVYPQGFIDAIMALPGGGSNDYTVTISLTNPVNGGYFDYCNINEANNSTDYFNMNKLGEITSPTGSVTITVDQNLYGICIEAVGNGSYQYYDSSNVSCTGGATIANVAVNAIIAITGDGTVTIDGINWYDD